MRRQMLPWLLLMAVSAGCAENQVTGKVSYEGKPVTLGTVVFVGADGVPRATAIDRDGSFLVKGVSPGQARIAVISINPTQPLDPQFEAELKAKYQSLGFPPPTRPDASSWFPIPQPYANVDTSELKADIVRGTTVVDVRLGKKG